MIKSALAVLTSLLFIHAGLAPAAAQTVNNTAKKPVKKAVAKRAAQPVSRTVAKGSLNNREKLVRKVTVVKGKRQVSYQRVSAAPSVPVVPPVMTAGDMAGLNLTPDPLALRSNVALVIDQANSQVLFEKNSGVALPIASVTKLMTALVVVEARQNMEEVLTVTDDDVDREKHSSSRLRVGATLSRDDMLHIALMSSENRAASALGRNYPGGLPAFVAAMNAKARSLGMMDTRYVDSTGLSSQNVASARDLAKLVVAAYNYPIIRQYSTDPKYMVEPSGHALQYNSSNRLTSNKEWDIGLQKTGFINEAGHCLVMYTRIEGRPIVMVFLDSKGRLSHVGDAARMRKWLVDDQPSNLTRMKMVRADEG
ncbi:D-alanyl-D-alanine endopeptidase [Herbaspirillum seropedicae]|uniref:D-alanyl-D-alanine-endopeptidase (Penicillin-binding) protein n=1 Tax=Herbaspirillum seropedicae (strain SmR1) TaxID=757424 RepID=D8IQP6_HERSS|nr:D-alanyl-D-alanine endopeptidase [Herbaspirillum seropedicae]ADJ63157.1 D-alanyl-D-alanine-endopeptidase (penicillin-binding) protein [Herbaspirillum seropedicae SmR1]AKN65208.1 D-alanyl-D-alanine carboxypeptidase [Herbaspirillum seropedicae]AON53970.1 D-alanyl-D-alanine-endopeptidase [Herbaspirillum seropedicae]NQE31439.1 D-alanyl-D-alanine carboxypeptidase [Herbaspirillum seropedicae]QDD64080.1 D-alanyl-D-alanine endopeptidase [Herbaspirillum seropedicae]